jgi:hypothetical protein
MIEESGKELVLTAPTQEVARRRSKPSLVKVGNRLVTSDGRFHPILCATYLLKEGKKWQPVASLAKIFANGNTLDGKKRLRKNMFRVFQHVLKCGEFLVYETVGPHNRINAVKLLDICSEQERQAAVPQLDRMKRRHQLSTEAYQLAIDVLERKQNMVAVMPQETA